MNRVALKHLSRLDSRERLRMVEEIRKAFLMICYEDGKTIAEFRKKYKEHFIGVIETEALVLALGEVLSCRLDFFQDQVTELRRATIPPTYRLMFYLALLKINETAPVKLTAFQYNREDIKKAYLIDLQLYLREALRAYNPEQRTALKLPWLVPAEIDASRKRE